MPSPTKTALKKRKAAEPALEPAVEVVAEHAPQRIVQWVRPQPLSAGVREYPPDQNPVLVYLASLASGESRRTMTKALVSFMNVFTARPASVIKRGEEDESRNSTAARARKKANEKKLLTFDWNGLRYQHVALAKTKLLERVKPASVNLVLNAVRGVSREAMRLGHLGHEDYERIRDVKGVKATRLPAGRHVEADEIKALFRQNGSDSATDVRNRALLAFARVTGCRRSEIVNVDLEHLDRKSYAVHIIGKGNKERLVHAGEAKEPLYAWLVLRGNQHGPLFCAIRKQRKDKDGELLPPHLTYRRMGATSIAYIMQTMAERAKVVDLSPHDLRRTFIGDLLDAGADISIAQRLAGHASVVTTQRYDRRPDRAAQTAASLIKIPAMPHSKSTDAM